MGGLYNIRSEFSIPVKLLRLIKVCLYETYGRVSVGKDLSDKFPIKNDLKERDVLSPLLFNFAVENAITHFQANQERYKTNGTYHLLINAHDVNLLGKNVCYRKENTAALSVTDKDTAYDQMRRNVNIYSCLVRRTQGEVGT